MQRQPFIFKQDQGLLRGDGKIGRKFGWLSPLGERQHGVHRQGGRDVLDSIAADMPFLVANHFIHLVGL
jgi:hypothetical protein